MKMRLLLDIIIPLVIFLGIPLQAGELPDRKIVLRAERTDSTGQLFQQALIFSSQGGKTEVRLVTNTTEFCGNEGAIVPGVHKSGTPGAWETDYRIGHQTALRLDRARNAPLPKTGSPHGIFYYLNEHLLSPGSAELDFVRDALKRACSEKKWERIKP